MPLYEYRCPECKYVWEVRCSIADKQEEWCGSCLKKAEQIFRSGGAFILEGEGFHKTDYPKHVNLRPGVKD